MLRFKPLSSSPDGVQLVEKRRVKTRARRFSTFSLCLLLSLVLAWRLSPLTQLTESRTVHALDNKSEEMKNAIDQAKKKLKETRAQIQSIQQEAAYWKDKISALELESEELKQERERILQEVRTAEETLLKRQQEQVEAEEAVIQKQEEYQKRISTMFYFRQRPAWELLLSSQGLQGFFTNMRMITAIAQSDASLLRELKHAEEVRQVATEVAERTHEAYKSFLEEKEAALADLEQGIIQARNQKTALDEWLTNQSMELQNEEQDIAAKEAAYQAYQAALKNYSGQIAQLTPAGSGAVWPLPASHQVYSPYGYRGLGFDAANGYIHTGTDFSGPNVAGTPVVAAWEGIVVTVHQPNPGQMYAREANYVQISHASGLGTGYWHLLSCAVAPGQHVAQGQIIGYCGSTGMSTGPHLHFEVYDQKSTGVRHTVDPMLYLGQ